jgi:hypothetical protein
MSTYQRFSRQVWVALVLATSACGSVPLNQAKLNEAQTALHAAETLGADQDPKAKQSLELARDKVTQAKRFGDQGDGEKGNLYLEQATVDADLASQLMRTRTEQQKAQQAWEASKAIGGPGQAAQ